MLLCHCRTAILLALVWTAQVWGAWYICDRGRFVDRLHLGIYLAAGACSDLEGCHLRLCQSGGRGLPRMAGAEGAGRWIHSGGERHHVARSYSSPAQISCRVRWRRSCPRWKRQETRWRIALLAVGRYRPLPSGGAAMSARNAAPARSTLRRGMAANRDTRNRLADRRLWPDAGHAGDDGAGGTNAAVFARWWLRAFRGRSQPAVAAVGSQLWSTLAGI